MRPLLLRPVLFIALLPLQAIAAEPLRPEVWTCKGVQQSAPGEALKPQERTLTLHRDSGRAVMKVEGAEYVGRFEASGPHLAAWFEWTGAGDEAFSEDANLGLVTGRLATSLKRKNGAQAGVYRGNCQPADAGAPAKGGGAK